MQTPLKRSCSAPCTCNRLVTFSLVLTIVLGTTQRVRFTIRSILLMKQNTSCDPFAMLNTLQRSFYGLLRTNVPPTHQSNRGLLPLFFKRKKKNSAAGPGCRNSPAHQTPFISFSITRDKILLACIKWKSTCGHPAL